MKQTAFPSGKEEKDDSTQGLVKDSTSTHVIEHRSVPGTGGTAVPRASSPSFWLAGQMLLRNFKNKHYDN